MLFNYWTSGHWNDKGNTLIQKSKNFDQTCKNFETNNKKFNYSSKSRKYENIFIFSHNQKTFMAGIFYFLSVPGGGIVGGDYRQGRRVRSNPKVLKVSQKYSSS